MANVIDFVPHQDDGLVTLSQQLDDLLVSRSGTHNRVDNEDDDIGEVNSDLCLESH